MTIKDLIAELQKYPEDTQVGVRNVERYGGFNDPVQLNDNDIRAVEVVTKRVAWWHRSTDILVIVPDDYRTREKTP